MNFLQLVQQLMHETGTHGQIANVADPATDELDRLVKWIQRADREICNRWQDWRFLWTTGTFTTSMAVAVYTAPADLRIYHEDSFYNGETRLLPVHHDDYRRSQRLVTDTGEPDSFVIQPDRSVRFLPTPDDAYTIDYEYQKRHSDLTANTNTPVIPTHFHDVIVMRARMYWASYEEAQLEYTQAATDFAEWMLRLEAEQLPNFENAHGRSEGIDIVVEAR